jgi:hypothetical protein
MAAPLVKTSLCSSSLTWKDHNASGPVMWIPQSSICKRLSQVEIFIPKLKCREVYWWSVEDIILKLKYEEVYWRGFWWSTFYPAFLCTVRSHLLDQGSDWDNAMLVQMLSSSGVLGLHIWSFGAKQLYDRSRTRILASFFVIRGRYNF